MTTTSGCVVISVIFYTIVLLDETSGVHSFSGSDFETPEQKRERILADSRKISMPIRPVGRPRKSTAEPYKEAEMASQMQNLITPSYNVFDLEKEDMAVIDAQIKTIYPPHQKPHQLNLEETIQSVDLTSPVRTGLVNKKGYYNFKY